MSMTPNTKIKPNVDTKVHNQDHHERHEREFAWRIFAGEYNNSTLECPGVDHRAPSYLVSPLGARVNRLYIVGVLTELEKIERNGNFYYRARISDRTGVFHIYAGQFDPGVTKVLAKLEPPTYVAVVGKSRRYSPSDGVYYVSIRPESIIEVDKSVHEHWMLDTCKNMKQRLECLIEARQLEVPNIETLEQLGYPTEVANGIVDSLNHYKKFDISIYRDMLVGVLNSLVTENLNVNVNESVYIDSVGIPAKSINEFTAKFRTGAELSEHEDKNIDDLNYNNMGEDIDNDLNLDTDCKGSIESDESDESDDLVFEEEEGEFDNTLEIPNQDQQEELLLNVLKSFKAKKYQDGIPWHELIAKADSKGVDKIYFEELVNVLLEKGRVYEPMLGRLKLMDS